MTTSIPQSSNRISSEATAQTPSRMTYSLQKVSVRYERSRNIFLRETYKGLRRNLLDGLCDHLGRRQDSGRSIDWIDKRTRNQYTFLSRSVEVILTVSESKDLVFVLLQSLGNLFLTIVGSCKHEL
jgi:hypothetical protein